jgi:hypothetical protein
LPKSGQSSRVGQQQRAASSSQRRTISARSIASRSSGSFCSAISRSRSVAARFEGVARIIGIARQTTPAGLPLTFKDHPAVAAELQALVEVENDCCSWAAWSVERDAEGALVMSAR